jgi:hypothetical protein
MVLRPRDVIHAHRVKQDDPVKTYDAHFPSNASIYIARRRELQSNR